MKELNTLEIKSVSGGEVDFVSAMVLGMVGAGGALVGYEAVVVLVLTGGYFFPTKENNIIENT